VFGSSCARKPAGGPFPERQLRAKRRGALVGVPWTGGWQLKKIPKSSRTQDFFSPNRKATSMPTNNETFVSKSPVTQWDRRKRPFSQPNDDPPPENELFFRNRPHPHIFEKQKKRIVEMDKEIHRIGEGQWMDSRIVSKRRRPAGPKNFRYSWNSSDSFDSFFEEIPRSLWPKKKSPFLKRANTTW